MSMVSKKCRNLNIYFYSILGRIRSKESCTISSCLVRKHTIMHNNLEDRNPQDCWNAYLFIQIKVRLHFFLIFLEMIKLDHEVFTKGTPQRETYTIDGGHPNLGFCNAK